MAYAIKVMVIDKKSRRGISRQRVKRYSGSDVYTDRSGMATVVTENSSVTIFVNGFTAYDGSASLAPNPVIYEKG